MEEKQYLEIINSEFVDKNLSKVNMFDIIKAIAKHFPNEIADPNVLYNIYTFLISNTSDGYITESQSKQIVHQVGGIMAICHCSPMNVFAKGVLYDPQFSEYKKKQINNLTHYEHLLEDERMVDSDSLKGGVAKSGKMQDGDFGLALDLDNITEDPKYITYIQLVKKF